MASRGRAHRLPDDVDTDQILPGRYLTTVPREELGEHVLEGYDPDLADELDAGDVLVAGENFGLGSSREAAPVAIRNAGVGAVVAESFARIFYRNAINVGLDVVELPGITDRVDDGHDVEVDPAAGTVTNHTTGETFETTPLPDDLLDILEAGGLVEHTRNR